MNWVWEILGFGLLYSTWLSVFILLSYKQNSRLWLHDYPKEMQALVPPKTLQEKKQMLAWALPVTGSMVFAPLLFVWLRHSVYEFTYAEAMLSIWMIMQIFSLIDLLILDWLITVWWRPRFIQLEGAEDLSHHDNYFHHFKGFIFGVGFSTIGAAITALPFVRI